MNGFEITDISVVDGHAQDETAFYTINVVTPTEKWAVTKRYSQFETLHNFFLPSHQKDLPHLPPKRLKLWTSHVHDAFIEERRALLDNYIRKFIEVDGVKNSNEFHTFLTKDRTDVIPAKKAPREYNAEEYPEDQEITAISISSTRTMSDHVLYQIDCSNVRKRKSFSNWTVLKRFGQFFVMDSKLREDLINNADVLAALPNPPPRKAKLWYDHMDSEFIEERRVLLENYLQKLLAIYEVATNENFLQFLGVRTD